MKRVLPVLLGSIVFGVFGTLAAGAQDRVPVTFKAFPPDYEILSGGDRLPYSTRADGLRVYQLPTGSVRISLTAPGTFPVSMGIEVKAGMGPVQAKLEPRQGPLTMVGEVSTGKQPRNLTFSADGKRLFVALQGEPGIEVFEVPALKKVGRVTPAEAGPGFSDVLTVGAEVWGVQRDGRVHAFDPATLTVKDSPSITGSGNAYLTDLGGGKVAVANWDNYQLFSVDASVRKVLNTLNTSGTIRGFAFHQGTGYVSLFDRGQVAVLDGATWKVKFLWPAGKAPRPVAALDGAVFVGDMASAQVLVLDPATGKVISTVGVTSNPHQMTASQTLGMVAVASRGRNNPDDYQLPGPDFGKVTLLNRKGEVLGSVWGRNQPTGLAFSADGKYLAFTDFLDNNVELYRVSR